RLIGLPGHLGQQLQSHSGFIEHARGRVHPNDWATFHHLLSFAFPDPSAMPTSATRAAYRMRNGEGDFVNIQAETTFRHGPERREGGPGETAGMHALTEHAFTEPSSGRAQGGEVYRFHVMVDARPEETRQPGLGGMVAAMTDPPPRDAPPRARPTVAVEEVSARFGNGDSNCGEKARAVQQQQANSNPWNHTTVTHELVDMLAHEIRNPLTGILGNLNLILMGLEERRQILASMEKLQAMGVQSGSPRVGSSLGRRASLGPAAAPASRGARPLSIDVPSAPSSRRASLGAPRPTTKGTRRASVDLPGATARPKARRGSEDQRQAELDGLLNKLRNQVIEDQRSLAAITSSVEHCQTVADDVLTLSTAPPSSTSTTTARTSSAPRRTRVRRRWSAPANASDNPSARTTSSSSLSTAVGLPSDDDDDDDDYDYDPDAPDPSEYRRPLGRARREPFDPRQLIDGAMSMLRAKASARGVSLLTAFPSRPSTRPTRGDPQRVRQVLINLLSNAINYTPSGGSVTVRVEDVVLCDAAADAVEDLDEARVAGRVGDLNRPALVEGEEARGGGVRGLRVLVTDTGVGMTMEERGQLFRRFSQPTGCQQSAERTSSSSSSAGGSSSSATESSGSGSGGASGVGGGGSGLGLMISKELVKAMGGNMGVSSEKGVGSTFSFTVRIFDDDAEVSAGEDGGVGNTAPRPRARTGTEGKERVVAGVTTRRAVGWGEDPKDVLVRKRAVRRGSDVRCCLIVEDNVVNQKILQRFLMKLNLRTFVANDGIEAVELLNNPDTCNDIDVIFMDVTMPRMGGLETTMEIRRRERTPGTALFGRKSTKGPAFIAAVSGNAMSDSVHAGLRAGMDDYLCKPYKMEDIGKICGVALETA
ncbi:hypothetical protein HK101_009835, partial [Irineochytrium annulatum]